MKPLPIALLAAAISLVAVVAQNPLCLAAALAGAIALLAAGGGPRRLYVLFAAGSAVTVFVLNPFVGAQGLTVLWQGPPIPVLDTQVTVEELVFGAAAGMRIAAAALAMAAFVRLADSDLVLRAVARVAPRSAMITALSAQMLPALERDAAGLVRSVRTRGAEIHRPRAAATLLPALLGMSLERSLSVAEAMEARGYGRPGRTRAPERRATPTEWVVTATATAALCVAVISIGWGVTDFRYYDTLGDPFGRAAELAAATLLVLLTTAAGMVRWMR
jgi:energy-coupling factor transporter transmembrane protein EcfT